MNVRRKREREFAFAFGALLAIAALLPVLRDGRPRWIVLAAAILLLAVGLLRPSALTWPARWWMALATVLNRIGSTIILSIIYFAVITPTGLYNRLRRRDSLQRAIDRLAATYWTDREADAPRANTLRRQF